jgi:UDP-N-acetylenolpyruvoylglucosamine reductase
VTGEWKRNGATKEEVTDLIGDLSNRMGEHYTRHVESEVNIIRAFERIKDRQP